MELSTGPLPSDLSGQIIGFLHVIRREVKKQPKRDSLYSTVCIRQKGAASNKCLHPRLATEQHLRSGLAVSCIACDQELSLLRERATDLDKARATIHTLTPLDRRSFYAMLYAELPRGKKNRLLRVHEFMHHEPSTLCIWCRAELAQVYLFRQTCTEVCCNRPVEEPVEIEDDGDFGLSENRPIRGLKSLS
jgi:hypothetical protein